MGARELVKLPDNVTQLPHAFGVFDDFIFYDNVVAAEDTFAMWLTDADTTGTVAATANPGGTVLCTSHTDDNDTAGFGMSTSPFSIGASYGPMVFGGRIKLTETDTVNNDANAAVLVCSTTGLVASQDIIPDSEAEFLLALGSLIAFNKRSTDDYWSLTSFHSASTAVTDTMLDLAISSGSWLTFEVSFAPTQAGEYEIGVRADSAGGQNLKPLYEYNGATPLGRQVPVKHTHSAWANSVAKLQAYVKTSAAQAELLEVDYLYQYQAR